EEECPSGSSEPCPAGAVQLGQRHGPRRHGPSPLGPVREDVTGGPGGGAGGTGPSADVPSAERFPRVRRWSCPGGLREGTAAPAARSPLRCSPPAGTP